MDLKQLDEQIEARQERLHRFIHQRNELEQVVERLINRLKEQQTFLSSIETLPLKINDIDRIQTTSTVSLRRLCAEQNNPRRLGNARRTEISTDHTRPDPSVE